MKTAKRKTLMRYSVASISALAIALPTAVYRGASVALSLAENCRYLSDGFFVAGLLVGGLGALVWVSTTGFFDIFSYAGHSLLTLFSSLRKPQDTPRFLEYKTMKDAKRGKPMGFLLLVGGVCIALSVLCLLVYYQ